MSNNSASDSNEYKKGLSAGFLLGQEFEIWKKINNLSPRDTLLTPLHESSGYITIFNLRSTGPYDVEHKHENELLYFNNKGIQYTLGNWQQK